MADNLDIYDNDIHMGEAANRGAENAEDLQRRVNLGKARSSTELEKGLKVRRLSNVLAKGSKLSAVLSVQPYM